VCRLRSQPALLVALGLRMLMGGAMPSKGPISGQVGQQALLLAEFVGLGLYPVRFACCFGQSRRQRALAMPFARLVSLACAACHLKFSTNTDYDCH